MIDGRAVSPWPGVMAFRNPFCRKKTGFFESAWISLSVVTVLLAASGARPARGEDAPRAAEARALGFLAREVPRWSRENRCFSCHNNGDAARALFAASKGRLPVPPEALADTIAFLARPERWERNGVDAAFSDKRLARLQFAVALASGIDAGVISDRSAMVRAARGFAKDQSEDGSWSIDDAALVGSPATYGRTLATALARRTLAATDLEQFAGPIAKADRWLRDQPLRSVLDASSTLLVFAAEGPADSEMRQGSLELLRKAQSHDGGWGPYVNSQPEVFDTALALLALARWPDRKEVEPLMRRGRAYLIANQAEDGSWPETTRPSGGESYAQRLSTTGWATLALLATEN